MNQVMTWLLTWSVSKTLVAVAIGVILVVVWRARKLARRTIWRITGALFVPVLVCAIGPIMENVFGDVHLPAQTASPTADPSGTTVTGQVTTVADGDTFTIATAAGKTRIRLLGIDAPEVAHNGTPAACGADLAAESLKNMLPIGTSVTVTLSVISDHQDQYGRTLGFASTNSIDDVALTLLQEGMVEAWLPAGQPHPERWDLYIQTQHTAQQANIGAWSMCDQLGR